MTPSKSPDGFNLPKKVQILARLKHLMMVFAEWKKLA